MFVQYIILYVKVKVKVKGNVHPITGHVCSEVEQRYSTICL